MRIESLNIRRYRAFDKEVEVPIGGLTVLTGPNNLGKSTVLSALDLLFSAIQRHSLGARSARYSYENDYPKRYLGKSGRRWPTEIRARIALSADDIAAAAPHVHGEIPEVLSIVVSYKWAENLGIYRPNIEFGGIDAEHKQALQIWLSNNLRYVYIPAARNVQDFRRGTFSELIAGAVTRVSRSRQRLQALQTLYDDVRSELSDVEKELANELKNYIPSVKESKYLHRRVRFG